MNRKKEYEKQKVSPENTAKLLNVRHKAVHEHMKAEGKEKWDIGEALPPQKTGKSVWEYNIYRAKLVKHIYKKIKAENKDVEKEMEVYISRAKNISEELGAYIEKELMKLYEMEDREKG